VIEWTSGKIAELIQLVQAGAVLLAIVTVGYAYGKTRSLVTLLVAALTAGVFLWAINNITWWQQRVDEETWQLRSPAGEVAAFPSWADSGFGVRSGD
jgi:hypothetical protein